MNKLTIITGNGKGKTTSAMALAAKAAIEGKRVYFGQFMKDGNYSEIKMIKEAFPEVTIEQYSGGFVLVQNPQEKDKALAQAGLEAAKVAVQSNEYDLIILDEINIVLFLEMVSLEEVLELVKSSQTPLIFTGRYADPALLALASGASYEMLQVKHYYNDGVAARVGFEM